MENEKKYWFYLEPYTFIFRSEQKVVIYNTLNSSYLKAPKSSVAEEALTLLEKASNGYCIVLNEEQAKDSVFHQFALQVRESFSGDLIEAESETSKPFIFKPILFLNTNIRKAKEEDFSFLGERVLENLNEASLYLPRVCEEQCAACGSYCKQMLHCACLEGDKLSLADYLSLLLDLNTSGVNKVNILGGNLVQNTLLQDLLPTLTGCKFKKVFHIHFNHLVEELKEWLREDNTQLMVSVHPGFRKELLEMQMKQFEPYPVEWKFIVATNADLLSIEQLTIPASVQTELVPFYNGNNLSFFKENVFASIEDIIEKPISRKTIFRRQTLNESFFGKLVILPSGKVYANLNCEPIGSYPQDSLKKLIFEELVHSTAWFRLRDKQPCNGCVNKFLCPSISNYELALDRDNLCLVE